MPPSAEYELPRPSKMKLKETKAEKAYRLYRHEQRRVWREARHIARANGYAVSPPRRDREESISPPRKQPRNSSHFNEDDDHVPSSHGREDREDWAEKMAWLEAEELGRFEPLYSYPATAGSAGQRIPSRHRPSAGTSFPVHRDPSREVSLDSGGPVPALGSMNDEEYVTWVREGMYRLRHKNEIEEAERIRAERQERDRLREVERERKKNEEKKKIEKLKREKGKVEEDSRKVERMRWRARCASLITDGQAADVVAIDLSFADVPWPVYRATSKSGVSLVLGLDDLTLDSVRTFLYALAEDDARAPNPVGDEVKRILREAILLFHPDRFFARILPRVRDTDKELVKEGVERCSRLINELAAVR